MPTQLADDENVDVAPDIIVATGVGAEHEGVADAALTLESLPQLRNDADGPRVEIAQRPVQRIRRIHPPHSEGPHPSAFDDPLPEQFFERELHRPRAALSPPHELARVELLA